MKSFILSSPAKLNLYLQVLNKRVDGFHNIKTLFERIDLADEITFTLNRKGTISVSCSHPHVPTGPKNLVYKVAQLLQQDYNVPYGVDIKIKKRIPVAAGLAGGSTNAATALQGLNRLWKLGLSRSKLISYACQIGSDVAFFLHDCSWALGTERGDKIKKVNLKRKLWHILVVPRVRLYSGRVYEALKLQLTPSAGASVSTLKRPKQKKEGGTNVLTKRTDNVNIFVHYIKKNNSLKVGKLLSNDLEPAILKICPKLLNLKKRLKSLNTQGVMISGSGPSVFGLVENEKEAKRIKSLLSKRYSQVFVVRTL